MIIAFVLNLSVQARTHILCGSSVDQCQENLQNYPLFDTPYKVASNYLPILPIRAFAHAEIYKDKKSCKLERLYYVKNLEAEFAEPYQKTILDIEVHNHGLFGRRIIATGKLNEFDLEYENKIGASLPRNASMKVVAKLAGVEFLNLHIKSDGKKNTNKVEGTYFAKEVKYQTEWRDTNGSLASLDYKLHTEGLHNEVDHFRAITRGSINEYEIFGHGTMVKPNYYEFEEHYGPIVVKSKLWIIEKSQ